jgi:hypothetical protein
MAQAILIFFKSVSKLNGPGQHCIQAILQKRDQKAKRISVRNQELMTVDLYIMHHLLGFVHRRRDIIRRFSMILVSPRSHHKRLI